MFYPTQAPQGKRMGILRVGARHGSCCGMRAFGRMTLGLPLFPHEVAPGVDAEEDEEQQRESPKRGATVAEEGERDADDRCEAQHHSHIDEHMEEEDAQHAIAVDAPEAEGLSLGQLDEPQYQGKEEQQHAGRAEEAFLLAHGAENEVGVLLWHELQLGLRAVEESLALQSARSDGYLALVDIVACARQVLVQAQQHVDAHPLVGLQHIVQHVVGAIEERYGADGEEADIQVADEARVEGFIEQVEDEQDADDELDGRDVKRDDEHGEQHHDDRCADGGEQHEPRALLVATVDVDHARGEDLHQEQDHELARRRVAVPEHHLFVFDAHHEIDDHGHGREEDAARHSLAVEHQEERQVDQGGARLALPHDE